MRYLITHPTDGVYLGNCLGLGFWSELDACGQDAAVTFESQEAAYAHIREWTTFEGDKYDLSKYTCVPIPVDTLHAEIEDCVMVGIKDWTENL